MAMQVDRHIEALVVAVDRRMEEVAPEEEEATEEVEEDIGIREEAAEDKTRDRRSTNKVRME